jgi:hypothetical protein
VLADHGWAHQAVSEGGRGENRVFVASRTPIVGVIGTRGCARASEAAWSPWRLAGGTRVTAAHIPDAQRSDRDAMVARTAVWREMLGGRAPVARRHPARRAGRPEHGAAPPRRGGRDVLVHGDAGEPRVDGVRRRVAGGARGARAAGEWRSHAGAGFRLDHALVSAPLAGAIRGAEYGQNALKNRLSDHAPLVVELADAA